MIRYTTAERGRIVQIQDRYKRAEDLGCCVHYFLDGKTPASLADDTVFNSMARVVGCEPLTLATQIFQHS